MRITLAALGFVFICAAALAWRSAPALFGRSRGRLVFAVRHLPSLCYHYCRALFLVERPLVFLYCHLVRRPMPGGEVRLRSGIRFKVSQSPDDIASIFCIFIKRDYGQVRRGSIVIDVGANIGIYTVYALTSGASQVFSVEPSEGSFQLLQENLQINRLSASAVCYQNAVAARSGQTLFFPKASDPSNSPLPPSASCDCTQVATLSLADLIARHQLNCVDHLKLDCEGAEYEIVLESPIEVWSPVRDLKIEYHRGRSAQLAQRLTHLGFLLQSEAVTTESVGHLWFHRLDTGAGPQPN